MRQRDQKEILRTIDREAENGYQIGAIVAILRDDFDISDKKAYEAVAIWIAQGGKLKAGRK